MISALTKKEIAGSYHIHPAGCCVLICSKPVDLLRYVLKNMYVCGFHWIVKEKRIEHTF